MERRRAEPGREDPEEDERDAQVVRAAAALSRQSWKSQRRRSASSRGAAEERGRDEEHVRPRVVQLGDEEAARRVVGLAPVDRGRGVAPHSLVRSDAVGRIETLANHEGEGEGERGEEEGEGEGRKWGMVAGCDKKDPPPRDPYRQALTMRPSLKVGPLVS